MRCALMENRLDKLVLLSTYMSQRPSMKALLVDSGVTLLAKEIVIDIGEIRKNGNSLAL